MRIGVIPARYGSTRFPGKPLALISGKPMIQYVYESSIQSKAFDAVYIATDDIQIEQVANDFGASVVLTPTTLQSGTDRVFAAIQRLKLQKKISNASVIVNIQGDEPLCPPELFQELVLSFEQNKCEICTPISSIECEEEFLNPNVVKVVVNNNNKALYFSRTPIPYSKEFNSNFQHFKHIGLYAYSPEVLEFFANSSPSSLELQENLEQLRLLQQGYSIQCFETNYTSQAVDKPEDIQKVESILSQTI